MALDQFRNENNQHSNRKRLLTFTTTLKKIMPEDPRLDEAKTLLDAVKADDVAEDAAYEATIAALTEERNDLQTNNDLLQAERDALLAEKASTIADLIASRDSLDARITALEG